jgi:hypothetical protein
MWTESAQRKLKHEGTLLSLNHYDGVVVLQSSHMRQQKGVSD